MIALENISVRQGRKLLLDNINADFSEAECWIITGCNGSGKSVLGKVIGGILDPWKGEIRGNAVTGYTSFELQEKVINEEKKKDSSRLMHGAVDEGTKISDFLSINNYSDPDYAEKMINMFSVSSLLERGMRFLSTGEFRKVLLLSALLKKPDLLVIDDPFDGLDAESRDHLKNIIDELIKDGCSLILISGRIEDFPPAAERMLYLSEGRVEYSGDIEKGTVLYRKKHEMFHKGVMRFNDDPGLTEEILHHDLKSSDLDADGKDVNPVSSEETIIEMKDTTISYGERKILDSVNWKVRRGEKWKITGVNGAGKSTLLSLVNGDNPQSYANDITLFGVKRGSGESIWDIKKRIGFVSGDFQFKYRVRCTVLDAVISGLYDSVGLYESVNESEIADGDRWLKFTGLYSKRGCYFTDLSFGEMRLVLIARAMIKDPELLILDEPCQGLDSFNRDRVLELCERIGQDKKRTVLFVTHDREVNLKCFTDSLVLEKK